MPNNHKFFENKNCIYYPCHKDIDKVNCLFCFCPLFNTNQCHVLKIFKKDKRSVCEGCSFPHIPKNYDELMRKLRKINEEYLHILRKKTKKTRR
jgi:Zn-finger protein